MGDTGRVFPTLDPWILVRFLIWLCQALRVWSLVGEVRGGLAEGSGGHGGWETALQHRWTPEFILLLHCTWLQYSVCWINCASLCMSWKRDRVCTVYVAVSWCVLCNCAWILWAMHLVTYFQLWSQIYTFPPETKSHLINCLPEIILEWPVIPDSDFPTWNKISSYKLF